MDLKGFLEDCHKGSKRRISSDEELSEEEQEDESTSEEEDELTYIEEDSESEPELDCDIWDSDCKTILTKPQNSISGYHLMPSCSRDPDENPKRIKIQPEINSIFLNPKFLKRFQESWNNDRLLQDSNNVELILDPFKVCVISNFLENPNILNDIRHEFYELDWNMRCMDLYEFFQSRDLKLMPDKSVLSTVYKFLKSSVMKWVSDLTGYELTHISATCSYYSNSDYLLVHDDQREDRKVAFVLYFTGLEKWNDEKGGALQLFCKDSAGHPSHVVKDIFPSNNQLVFFPVTSDSYHQVSEVMSRSDCRFSINGWFHTKIPPVFEQPVFKPHSEGLFSENSEPAVDFDIELSSWLNEDYLKSDVSEQIQEYFEEHSEICLKNFLKSESFTAVSKILESETIKWTRLGPPNRFNYEVVDRSDIPSVLERFLKLFQSKQMFSLLQKFTDLDLTKDSARMKYELQKWTPGCYSLLSDYDWHKKKELDLIIHFGCKNISDVLGARTQYVTIEDEIQNALITIDPEENNLNIIYRDTARFTKYFSQQSKCSSFFTLICSYSE